MWPLCEQEAEVENDEEAVRVVDWDRSAADAAYRAEVARAQERQRAIDEEAALLLQVGCLQCWRRLGSTTVIHCIPLMGVLISLSVAPSLQPTP